MRTPAQFLVGLVLLFSVFALHRTVHAADATVTILWRDDGSASGSPSASTFTTNINFYVQNVGDQKTLLVQPQSGFRFKEGPTVVPVDNGITVSGSGGNYTVTIVTAKKQGQAQIQGKIERSPSGGGGGGGTPPERPFDISVLQKWVYIRYSVPSNGTNLIAAVGSTNDLTSIVALGDGSPASGKVNWNAGSLGTFTANDVDLASGSASTKFVASTDAGNGTIAATGQNLKDSGDLSVPNASTNLSVRLVKVEVTQASIRDGQFQVVLNSSGANLSGTLRLKLKKNSTVVELASLSNQADGTVTIQLDDYIENLASHNAEQYTVACAAWTVAGQDITSQDKTLDSEVKVLATWKISNYFTPTWGGSWDGTSLTKGMYASGTYPGGLTNVTVKTSFLNSLDPANEGLAVDGSTVIRDHAQDAVAGFERVTFLGGGAGYIENPDRDQQTAGGCPGVPNITSQTIAVTPNNPDLGCGAEAYIPGFKVKTVQDHGSLNGNNKQIDVWIGAGDQSRFLAVFSGWPEVVERCRRPWGWEVFLRRSRAC